MKLLLWHIKWRHKSDNISIITKEMLLESISSYNGSIDTYMKEIEEKHYYIEVQLWNDEYCIVS